MKKVITNKELQECELEAIHLLCSTVKKTLGPRGSNAIIDHSLLNPFITNDGVTIARNIESEDERVNTILTLAKEASIKTDEMVGDGTTTTLVLLESIFKKGLEKIKAGINPNILKKELDEATEEVLIKIKEESKMPTKKDYFYIASIASSDEEIGSMISDTYLKLKRKGTLKIEESESQETYAKIITGYTFDTLLSSPYFLTSNSEIEYQDSYLLLLNTEVNEMEEISTIMNFLIEKKIPAVILAKDYSEEVINEVLSLNFNRITNVILLEIPEYGTHQMDLLQDLEVLTNAKIESQTEKIEIYHLGKCKNIKINKDKVIIISDMTKELNDHVNKLKQELIKEKDSYEQDFLNERIAKLTTGQGIIYVGARTPTERREKKMRFDDALSAIECASDGIIPGSGLILLKISKELENKHHGYDILKEALNKPFRQILENAGSNIKEIETKIEENNFNILYNSLEETYEDINKTKVIDPTNVVINTVKNAVSIASMLLTTTTLIINEHQEVKQINLNNEI